MTDALTIRQDLLSKQGHIATVLPKGMDAKQLINTAMLAIGRNPKLLDCQPATIFESVMRAAELGLMVSGTMGDAYLVPFGTTCQLIPGWQGLAKLARQSGEIAHLEAEVVYEHDKFDLVRGTDPKLTFKQKLSGDRGKAIGAYALAKLRDGSVQVEYMSVEEIEKVRAVSRAGKSGPWAEWWGEMARKTVFRRLAKWLPKHTGAEKLVKAIELADAEYQVVEVETGPAVTPEKIIEGAGKEAKAEPEAEGPGLEEVEAKVRKMTRDTLLKWIDNGQFSDILGDINRKLTVGELRDAVVKEIKSYYGEA